MANESRVPKRRSDVFLAGFFALCLAFNLWAASVGWFHSLLDLHGFRQTQTAISTFSLLQGGPWFAYETPVLGPPWSIPFEFPLYQWTVAATVRLLALPLDQTGRLVSLLYFYLSLPAAYMVLGQLGVRRSLRFVFLGLWLMSPEYLFWSRTFMIESAAVCLGLYYVAVTTVCAARPGVWTASGAALLGALAGMVKLTTFAGFALAAALLVLRTWRRQRPSVGQLVVVLIAAGGIPLGASAFWTHFGDAIKEANPIAAMMVSSQPDYWRYIFGPIAMRWDAGLWTVIFNRTTPDTIGHWAVLVASAVVLVLAPQRWREAVLCLGVFLAVALIFANLHFIHNYYAYANALFLVAYAGFAIVSLLEGTGWRRPLGAALLLGVAATEAVAYLGGYYQVQRRDHPSAIGPVLQRLTDASDVLVVYSQNWSSEIPYYARRRALMHHYSASDAAIRAAEENVKAYRVGAGVFCADNRQREDLIRRVQQTFRLQDTPFTSADGCDVYLGREAGAAEDAWESTTMGAGIDALYARRDPTAAIAQFRNILERRPSHYGANYQLATALGAAGRRDEARPFWEKVLGMAEAYNDSATMQTAQSQLGLALATSDELMRTGLDALYKRRDAAVASVYFRALLERIPQHYGATYQLATALDAAGRRDQARPLWEKVLTMAEAYNDPSTTDTARQRLAER